MVGTRMNQGFVNRFVGVLQFDIFADHCNGAGAGRVDDPLAEFLPLCKSRRGCVTQSDFVHHQTVDLVLAQIERTFVDGVIDIAEGHHVLLLDIAEHRDLAAVVLVEVVFGAADDDVWLDADFAKLGHRLLGRLGFDLSGGTNQRQKGHVNEADVLFADFQCPLTKGLQKQKALHIPHRAADLGDQHVDVGVVLGNLTNAILNLVGDMRNKLHGLTKILPLALFFDNRIKDLAGGQVVHLR